MATDDFNRADAGTLGANWTNVAVGSYSNGYKIVSNKAQPINGGGGQLTYRSAETFSEDHYSEGVCADDPYALGVAVRVKVAGGTTVTGYHLYTGRSTSTFVLSSISNAGGALLTTFGAVFPLAGDTIKLSAQTVGGNVVLRGYLNGVQIGSDYTDSTLLYSGGAPGLLGEFTGFDDFDSWVGADLAGGGGGPTLPFITRLDARRI